MRARVLVVDDDPTLASIAGEMLELAGYDVRIQNSPFGTSVAMSEFRPHIVLLDVNVPALPGDKLVPLIRTSGDGPRPRIVFFSSNDEATLRQHVIATGADGFIRKGDIDRLGLMLASYATTN